MDLHCPLTCGRCRTRRDMRISGQKIKMSDWGKLWSNKGKPQKLLCCRVQSKGVRNLESENFFSWNRESCALEFGIQIKNPDPTIDWNPEHDPSSTDKESGIHYLYLRSGIMGVESRIQDCLGFPYMAANCHWLRLWPPLKMCKQLHHVTGGHQLHWGTRMNWSILRTCTQPNN